MNKINTRIRMFIIAFSIMLIICGCTKNEEIPGKFTEEYSAAQDEVLENKYDSTADEIYQEAFERFMDTDQVEKMEGKDIFEKMEYRFLNAYHRTYRVFRRQSPVIIICSIVIGVAMMVLAKKNKKVQRTGLVVFIIGIPSIVIIAVFGIGILNGVLLY